MKLEMELIGDDEIVAALRQSPQIVGQEAKKASDASLLMLVGDLKQYPPAPPASAYVRTMTLGRTWAAASPAWKTTGSGFEGRIGNPTPYAPEVQGQGTQARVHRGRWRTDEDVIEGNYDRIKAYFAAAAQRIVNRLGGG